MDVFEQQYSYADSILNALDQANYARMRCAFISFNTEAYLYEDFRTRTKEVDTPHLAGAELSLAT